MDLVLRTLGNAAGLWIALAVVPGISIPGTPSTALEIVNLLVVGLVLALVNSIVRPIAKIVALPLYVLTFGLFSFVLNGLMLLLTSKATDALVGTGSSVGVPLGLHVHGLPAAVVAALVVSVVGSIVVWVLGLFRRG